MDKDVFRGQWKEIKGRVKEKWGKLSDDDLAQVEGNREKLIGMIQKKYGYEKTRAEQEFANWEKDWDEEFSEGSEFEDFPSKRKQY